MSKFDNINKEPQKSKECPVWVIIALCHADRLVKQLREMAETAPAPAKICFNKRLGTFKSTSTVWQLVKMHYAYGSCVFNSRNVK
jgi:hypothetical protein